MTVKDLRPETVITVQLRYDHALRLASDLRFAEDAAADAVIRGEMAAPAVAAALKTRAAQMREDAASWAVLVECARSEALAVEEDGSKD